MAKPSRRTKSRTLATPTNTRALRRAFEHMVLLKERIQLVRHYQGMLISSPFSVGTPPSVADACTFAPIQRLLTLPIGRFDESQEPIEIELKDRALPELGWFHATWRRDIAQRLLPLLPPELARNGTPPADVLVRKELVFDYDPGEEPTVLPFRTGRMAVELAAPMFRAGCCPNEPLGFDDLLAHRCFTRRTAASAGTGVDAHIDKKMEDLFDLMDEQPWNYRDEIQISFDEEASRAVKHVVTVAGGPADQTWTVAMDSCRDRFWCTQCGNIQNATIFSWRQAVRHIVDQKHSDAMQLLGAADRVRAIQAEDALPLSAHDPVAGAWRCGHCVSESMSSSELKAHLRSQHQITPGKMTLGDYGPSPGLFCPAWKPVTFNVTASVVYEDYISDACRIGEDRFTRTYL